LLALGLLGFAGAAERGLAADPSPSTAPAEGQASGFVYVLPATGVIDNVLASYLADGIARAGRDGAEAVVIELDTPGGSIDAMKKIVSAELEAPLPTIVWVAPAGAQAASAGTFVTLAANLSFMAPGTRIGAATPVGGQGEDIPGDLGKKVLNDTIAYATSIAQARDRPVDWAVETVRDARSSPAIEAVQLGAVDGIAATEEAVRDGATGRTVEVGGTPVTLDLAGDEFRELEMNPLQGLIHLLSDPNIAFILFTLGFYGLFFELQNPNFVTGILGALAIILAFIGFGSLPLNVAAILLIALGFLLFALEPTVTSHGLLTIGGIVCLVLGASALYSEPGPFQPDVSVAIPLIVTVTSTTSILAFLIVIAAVRSRSMQDSPGLVGTSAGPGVGTPGEVRVPLEPLGSIYAAGEEWSARTADERLLERGTPVRVVGIDGLTLIVEPDSSPPTAGASSPGASSPGASSPGASATDPSAA
jgi:membrane-bound serine protease (ClpP class)